MALLTLRELEIWSRTEITTENGDLANMLIDAVTQRVLFECGNPDGWNELTTPAVVRSVVIPLASRSFRNIDSIAAEGSIGPIGGDRFVEDMARALELTQAELDILHNAPGALPTATSGGRLWVLGTEDVEEPSPIIYMFDAPGPAMVLVGDNAGANWAIPMIDVDQDPFYKPLPAP
jgi:hypothetical protein